MLITMQNDRLTELQPHELVLPFTDKMKRREKKDPSYRHPIVLYSPKEVDTACYYGENALVRYAWQENEIPGMPAHIFDIGSLQNRGVLLHTFINDLRDNTSWFMDDLENNYRFQASVQLHDPQFRQAVQHGQVPRAELEKYRETYKTESRILLQALEQTLALIYNNPLLREMLAAARETLIVRTQQAERYISEMEMLGLQVTVENHIQGFRGSSDNHGSLFGLAGDKIELRLDNHAVRDVRELIHELAAFLILKKSRPAKRLPSVSFLQRETPDQKLEKEKSEKLGYILLFIDALSDTDCPVEHYFRI